MSRLADLKLELLQAISRAAIVTNASVPVVKPPQPLAVTAAGAQEGEGHVQSVAQAAKKPDLDTIMEQIEALQQDDPSALAKLANRVRQADHLTRRTPQKTLRPASPTPNPPVSPAGAQQIAGAGHTELSEPGLSTDKADIGAGAWSGAAAPSPRTLAPPGTYGSAPANAAGQQRICQVRD